MKNNWKSAYVFIHIEFYNWAGWYITYYSLLGQVLNRNWRNRVCSKGFVVVGNLFRAEIIWKRSYFCGQKNGSTGRTCRFLSVIWISYNITLILLSEPKRAAVLSKGWFCGRSLAGIAVSNPSGSCVCCDWCVLWGRGLCDGSITHQQES